jgi:hypothetical protein
MGLEGAAIAWTLRVTLNCLALYGLSGCMPLHPLRMLPAIGLMLACLAAAMLIPMTAATALSVAIMAGLAFAILTYLLDPALRGAALSAGRRLRIFRGTPVPQRDSA